LHQIHSWINYQNRRRKRIVRGTDVCWAPEVDTRDGPIRKFHYSAEAEYMMNAAEAEAEAEAEYSTEYFLPFFTH